MDVMTVLAGMRRPHFLKPLCSYIYYLTPIASPQPNFLHLPFPPVFLRPGHFLVDKTFF